MTCCCLAPALVSPMFRLRLAEYFDSCPEAQFLVRPITPECCFTLLSEALTQKAHCLRNCCKAEKVRAPQLHSRNCPILFELFRGSGLEHLRVLQTFAASSCSQISAARACHCCKMRQMPLIQHVANTENDIAKKLEDRGAAGALDQSEALVPAP